MTRTNVSLQPSKQIVAMAAAQIYSAYVTVGRVQVEGDVEDWINRSVREAVAIAVKVDESVQSDRELPDHEKLRLRELPDDAEYPKVAPQD